MGVNIRGTQRITHDEEEVEDLGTKTPNDRAFIGYVCKLINRKIAT